MEEVENWGGSLSTNGVPLACQDFQLAEECGQLATANMDSHVHYHLFQEHVQTERTLEKTKCEHFASCERQGHAVYCRNSAVL